MALQGSNRLGRPPDYLAESSVSKAIHLLDLKTREISTLPGSEGLFGPRRSLSGCCVAALTLNQKTLLLFDMRAGTWGSWDGSIVHSLVRGRNHLLSRS